MRLEAAYHGLCDLKVLPSEFVTRDYPTAKPLLRQPSKRFSDTDRTT